MGLLLLRRRLLCVFSAFRVWGLGFFEFRVKGLGLRVAVGV